MEGNKMGVDEKVIVEDIEHSLDLYDLNELSTENEVVEAVSIISELSSRYRHLHVQLSLAEGYEELYPEYGATVGKMNKYIRDARTKIRNLKVGSENKFLAEENVPVNKSEVVSLEIKAEVLFEKVELENMSVDLITATDESEINKYVSKMEQFIDNFFDLSAEMRQKCPVVYKDKFERQIANGSLEIRQDIKMAKILKREILLVREKLSKGAIFQKNQAQHETKAENLLTELRIRFKTLSKKYGVNLEELGDYQILDLQQEKSMDLEFNEILDKVTELSSLAHLVGEKMCATIEKVRKTRDNLVSKREVFSDTLRKIMIERDITLEK